MKPIDTIATLTEEKDSVTHSQLSYDSWDFSMAPLEEAEQGSYSPLISLIGGFIFILVILFIILI